MQITIEENYDKIYRYCYFRLGNAVLAEDLTQETFLRFLESRNYREAGRPLAYLYTIARNLCVDQYRKPREEPLNQEKTADWMWGEGFEEETIKRLQMEQALGRLEEQERELLLLRYVNELPFSVLCELYRESRFVLHRRLKKAAARLELELQEAAGAGGAIVENCGNRRAVAENCRKKSK